MKRTRIPRVDDDGGPSALPHKYHENAFISIVLYTTESTSMLEIYRYKDPNSKRRKDTMS